MNFRNGILIGAATLFLGCGGDRAAPHNTAPAQQAEGLKARIDSIVEQALRDGPLAGLSVAVYSGSEPVIVKGYGFADVAGRVPASADTRYDIASVSKLFTALAIMKLVEEGKLALDDDLATLLPAFPNPDQGRRISLRQLLNHTSGLNDYLAADVVRSLRRDEPPEALSASFVFDYLADRPLDFDPSTDWQYSNSAFYLAGLIIEQVSGQAWGDYVREAIARPLGLNDTSSCGDLRPEQRSLGYEAGAAGVEATFTAERLYAAAGIQGDGGLCSSVRDLGRLPAAVAARRLIPASRVAEVLQPTTLADGTAIDYGLGTRLGRLDGHPLWGHTGSVLLSYSSTLAHYPEDDLTIAVLVNTSGGTTDALVIEGLVAQEVLGVEEPLSSQTLSTPASTYAGEYVGDRYYDPAAIAEGVIPNTRERFRIVNNDGRLERIALTADPRPALELIYRGNHAFGRADWPMDTIAFHVEDGQARGYSEYYNGIFATFHKRVAP